ncbi:MAG: UDP-N-acetylmuramate dehydrogenase [Bacteroidales bacterium]|nr:UDP-N-acetylmuramate dehydrogenase [Bacteroidales bacterium]
MLRIEHNVDMTGRNTFGMKVVAACVVEYDEVADLAECRRRLESGMAEGTLPTPFKGPVLHIGACSNLLFTKEFFPGILLHSNIRYIRVLDDEGLDRSVFGELVSPQSGSDTSSDCRGEVKVEVGAGVTFDDFCAWAAEKGLWGVENLSGIPGEAGAAAVQNIGAYGVEVKDVILKVNCYDMVLGRSVSFGADDCGYGYRTSLFKTHRKGRYIVTSVTFRLSREARPALGYGHLRAAVEAENKELTPGLIRDVVLRIRNGKLPDPKVLGSAGSFFKNPVVPRSDYDKAASIARFEFGEDCKLPFFDVGSGFVKIPAAWLIEHCGWKGRRMGGAGVYEGQPLVLVNVTGEATAAEVIALEETIVKSVKDKFDITLSPEVEHV